MKNVKDVLFNELVLIPAREKFEEDYYLSHYCGCLGGSGVNVLLFNCSNIIELVELIDVEIEDLRDYISKNAEVKEEVEEIDTQINFFSHLKEKIENQSLHHDPPQEIINCLLQKGFQMLDINNIFFLSGVSSLVEA